jgi:hypothetical protein
VGSNNLTREGLLHNVEFATLIKSVQRNPDLERWFQSVHGASESFDDALVKSYEKERRKYSRKRSSAGTFTWSKRGEPTTATERLRSASPITPRQPQDQEGDLVVEVMPRETGPDGKQMQLPKSAAVQFFGLCNQKGASRQVTLIPVGTSQARILTMTLFGNNTARLSITELDYRDRPCVILFHKREHSDIAFEIVQQSIFPDRYRHLLLCCGNQTRTGSRRWAIL